MLEVRRIDRVLGIVVDLGAGLAHPRCFITIDGALAVIIGAPALVAVLAPARHGIVAPGEGCGGSTAPRSTSCCTTSFERLGDVARAEPFCSVSMRRVEVLNHRLLPGIADPSLEVNQASASAKDK